MQLTFRRGRTFRRDLITRSCLTTAQEPSPRSRRPATSWTINLSSGVLDPGAKERLAGVKDVHANVSWSRWSGIDAGEQGQHRDFPFCVTNKRWKWPGVARLNDQRRRTCVVYRLVEIVPTKIYDPTRGFVWCFDTINMIRLLAAGCSSRFNRAVLCNWTARV